jgi:hypothetical protein
MSDYETPEAIRAFIEQRNQLLSFDEPSHTYTVAGVDAEFVSVTGVIKTQFKPFEVNIIAAAMAKSANLHKKPDYAAIAAVESLAQRKILIKEQWKAAAEKGTAMHAWAEQRILRNPTTQEDVDESLPIEYQFLAIYLNSMIEAGIVLYIPEVRMYDILTMVAGMADLITMNPDGTFNLVDFKRSRLITSKGNGWGTTRHTKKMKDCNLMHYYVQLNLYKWLLEKNYHITISSMLILNCHPNNSGYMIHKVPDMQGVANGIMMDRARMVQQSSVAPPAVPPDVDTPPASSTHVHPARVCGNKRTNRELFEGCAPSDEKTTTQVSDWRPATLLEKRQRVVGRRGQWIDKKIPDGYHDDIVVSQDKRRQNNNPKLHEFTSEKDIVSYITHRGYLDIRNQRQATSGDADIVAITKQKLCFLRLHILAMWRLLSPGQKNNNKIRAYMRDQGIQNDLRLNSCIRYLYRREDEEKRDAESFEISDIQDPRDLTAEEASYVGRRYQ